MKKLSVVIPVYYNEESLPVLFAELLETEKKLQNKNVELELIFVDDGSGDNSLLELLKIKQQHKNTKVIKLTRNFGVAHASKAGIQFVTGDCFLILAADLQDSPSLIIEMVDKWLNGAKFVVCTRSKRNDPIISKIFSYIYYKLVRFFIMKDYPAGGFDMALMDRDLLPYLLDSSKNIYTPILSFWLGFKPEILSYKRQKRIYGKSRWTFLKKMDAIGDSILGFSVVPLRIISLIGLIVAFFSFGYGFWILINAILGRTEVPGFATIVVLISFLMGIIIFILSLIGEYLWRIFIEVNKRPESVIDEIY